MKGEKNLSASTTTAMALSSVFYTMVDGCAYLLYDERRNVPRSPVPAVTACLLL